MQAGKLLGIILLTITVKFNLPAQPNRIQLINIASQIPIDTQPISSKLPHININLLNIQTDNSTKSTSTDNTLLPHERDTTRETTTLSPLDHEPSISQKQTTPISDTFKTGTTESIHGLAIMRRSDARPIWLFVILMLQCLLLVYLKITYMRRLNTYMKAYINLNLAQQLLREEETGLSLQAIVLMINFLLSSALLFLFSLTPRLDIPTAHTLTFYLEIVGLTGFLLLLKYFGYRFLEEVFPFSEELRFYRFIYFMNYKLLGIVLLPLVYVSLYARSPFSEWFSYTAWAVFFLSLIVRNMKGLIIGARHMRQHTFHFLTYICTFEFAPLLILIKWLQIMTSGHS